MKGHAVMNFNILQIVQEFSLDGGVETVAHELQRNWVAAGVPSSVLASAVAADGLNTRTVRRIAPLLNRIPTRGRWRHLGRLLVVPAFTVAATKFVRSKAAGAVVLSHGDTLAGDVCVIHAVNKASLQDKIGRGGVKWMLNPLHYWVALRDRWMIGGLRYRRYVAVSSRIADELNQLYAVPYSRIAVIPNGIDLVRFTPEPGIDADVRKEFAIPASARLLLFVGHEFERKGLAPVIEALSLLPEAHLLIVGSDDRAPYRQMAEAAGVVDRIRFAGARADMPRLYRASDAFVFPTSYESFSLVCMEAMACGTPIFATLVGGIEEYLEAGVNGYAITRDPEVIARQIRQVLDDPEELRRLRAGARTTAERYSWALVAERYKELLEVVWREKGGRDKRACARCPGDTVRTDRSDIGARLEAAYRDRSSILSRQTTSSSSCTLCDKRPGITLRGGSRTGAQPPQLLRVVEHLPDLTCDNLRITRDRVTVHAGFGYSSIPPTRVANIGVPQAMASMQTSKKGL